MTNDIEAIREQIMSFVDDKDKLHISDLLIQLENSTHEFSFECGYEKGYDVGYTDRDKERSYDKYSAYQYSK